MAKIPFSSENKARNSSEYPTLKFQTQGEQARIALLEAEPEIVFRHTLRAPKIVNGEVAKKTINGKNGTFQVDDEEWVGSHMCFGDIETLFDPKSKGIDPKNCPTCAEAEKFDYIDAPDRRYGLHVVRYKTVPGSFKVQQPFQAELLIWAFANKVYNTLTDLTEETGDLRGKDLLLTCENKTYQNTALQPGSDAVWRQDDTTKQFVIDLFKANKCEDVETLLARKISRDQALEDIEKVKMKRAQAYGGTIDRSDASGVAGGSAALDLDDMLKDDAPAQEAPAASEKVAETVSSPGLGVESTPDPEAQQEEKKDSGKDLNFDDFLNDL